MVRPVSFKGFQKGFQGVSLRGFRGFQIFLRKLCVCIKYLSLGDLAAVCGGFLVLAQTCFHAPSWKQTCSLLRPTFLDLFPATIRHNWIRRRRS